MKAKVTLIVLLAVIFISSSVSSSPLLNPDRINSVWSYIYSISARSLNRFEIDGEAGGHALLGGDADDYANGRDRDSEPADERRILDHCRPESGSVHYAGGKFRLE